MKTDSLGVFSPRRLFPLFWFLAFLGSLGSCSGKWILSPSASPSASAAQETPKKKAPRHALDGRRILLLAGKAYAGGDPASDPLYAPLIEEFGLLSEGGMLGIVTSPQELLEDPSVTAVIVLAGPERTVRTLLRLRNERPGILILSIFPVDETLAVEAVSDLVIDLPVSPELLADENAPQAAAIPDGELSFLLLAAALFSDTPASDPPPVRFDGALAAARKSRGNPAAASLWSIVPYKDGDTGLKSRNHLVVDIPGSTGP